MPLRTSLLPYRLAFICTCANINTFCHCVVSTTGTDQAGVVPFVMRGCHGSFSSCSTSLSKMPVETRRPPPAPAALVPPHARRQGLKRGRQTPYLLQNSRNFEERLPAARRYGMLYMLFLMPFALRDAPVALSAVSVGGFLVSYTAAP